MSTATSSPVKRIVSVDAYRGMVILLMLGELMRFRSVSRAFPDSAFWKFLAFHQTHVEWAGCALHDLIQPSFMFLVGLVLPFSLISRQASGETRFQLYTHAILRAVILIALGIFLESLEVTQTNFTFHNTLTQIGLGYFPLFLLAQQGWKVQVGVFLVIMVGYWGLFAWYPAPGPEFDWNAVDVPLDWRKLYQLGGFSAHWNKNSNVAWAFDVRWLNLFPRETRFTHYTGGLCSLSCIPAVGTMLLGLLAGEWLRTRKTPVSKLAGIIFSALLCLGVGFALSHFDICPIVKGLWTPAWVFFSGGWCLVCLGCFYLVIEIGLYRAWAFPLIVIGSNPIVAFCSGYLLAGPILAALYRHIGQRAFLIAGEAYSPLLEGATIVMMIWLIHFWLYRNKVFIRI